MVNVQCGSDHWDEEMLSSIQLEQAVDDVKSCLSKHVNTTSTIESCLLIGSYATGEPRIISSNARLIYLSDIEVLLTCSKATRRTDFEREVISLKSKIETEFSGLVFDYQVCKVRKVKKSPNFFRAWESAKHGIDLKKFMLAPFFPSFGLATVDIPELNEFFLWQSIMLMQAYQRGAQVSGENALRVISSIAKTGLCLLKVLQIRRGYYWKTDSSRVQNWNVVRRDLERLDLTKTWIDRNFQSAFEPTQEDDWRDLLFANLLAWNNYFQFHIKDNEGTRDWTYKGSLRFVHHWRPWGVNSFCRGPIYSWALAQSKAINTILTNQELIA